jgi:cell division protease FtsH
VDKQPPWRGELWMVVLSVLAVAFMILIGVRGTEQSETPRSVEYSALLAEVQAGSVTSVTVHDPSGRIDVLNKDGSKSQVQGPAGGIPDPDVAVFEANNVGRNYRHDSSGGFGLSTLLSLLLPIGLIVGLWLLLTRSASRQLAGAAKFGKTTAKVQLTPRTKTTFNDIAGYDGVKEEIREVVDFLVAPDRFKEIGARIP